MKLIERAKNIVLTPKTEWPVIASEPATTSGLYTAYVIPLAAIGPVASFIGLSALGALMPTGVAAIGAGVGVVAGLLSFLLALVSVFVLGLIVDALAPTFGGTKNPMQALKLAVYASTPSWLGGIFGIFPLLAILGLIAAAYSVYLLYLGLPVMMKSPADKSAGYTAVTVVCAAVLSIVVSMITGAVLMSGIAGGVMGPGLMR